MVISIVDYFTHSPNYQAPKPIWLYLNSYSASLSDACTVVLDISIQLLLHSKLHCVSFLSTSDYVEWPRRPYELPHPVDLITNFYVRMIVRPSLSPFPGESSSASLVPG